MHDLNNYVVNLIFRGNCLKVWPLVLVVTVWRRDAATAGGVDVGERRRCGGGVVARRESHTSHESHEPK
ncbi:hypothetical protein HMPREF9237_00542 [Actinotignum schaalii FB123-CNA-2]|uniref:Uncharacterized protein n=1 Tax=Actinotignum schaalii FB123-CNA-2 TaxID=883067 RepID=S2VJA4_9ACTO|nr:hypothetical protein HMPREF9237_00542 [Actinotignum schaalii FB123-CNA-2]